MCPIDTFPVNANPVTRRTHIITNQFQGRLPLTNAEMARIEQAARKERAQAMRVFGRMIGKALRRVFLLEGGVTVYVPGGKGHVSA